MTSSTGTRRRSHQRRRRVIALVAFGAAAALSVGSFVTHADPAVAATKTKQVSDLKWAIASAPRSIDMYSDFSTNANTVSSLVTEGLVTLKNLKLEPALATSWKATSPTTYVYQLRKGVKFSDGNPVTAADVAYSFNRNIAAGSTSQTISHLKTLKSADVTGAHQVTITLTQPDATWIYDPLFAPIVEQSVVEKYGSKYGAPGEPVVGTGPYTVKSFDASKGITLTRNNDYWGKKPSVKRVDFSYVSDPNALALALRAGDVDGSFGISLSSVKQFASVRGVKITKGTGLSTASLMFDMDTAPFDDIHVRKAISYAWDGAAFTKNVLGGYGTAANSIAAPGFWTNLASAAKVKKIYKSIPTYSFDMKKAKAELKASKVPHGFSTSISYPDSHPELGQALQVLAQNLTKIGIKLKVTEIPYQQWVTLISAHENLTIQIAQWNPDYPDPSDFVLSQYASSHAVKNQYNLSNYKNSTVDSLIDSELASTDKATRTKDLTTILKTVAKDAPNLNMYWPDTLLALRSDYKYSDFNGLYASEKWIYNVSAK